MIKSDLIQRISVQNPHLYQRDIEKIVRSLPQWREATASSYAASVVSE